MQFADEIFRLQWGRADKGAETRLTAERRMTDMRLQWGRADKGAETLSVFYD